MNRQGIDLNQICEDYGIKLFKYSNPRISAIMEDLKLPTTSSGYAIVAKNGPAILYDDRRSEQDIRFTVAHELGHILLGHLDYRQKAGKMPEFAEKEADTFAVMLIIHDILCRYGMEAAL